MLSSSTPGGAGSAALNQLLREKVAGWANCTHFALLIMPAIAQVCVAGLAAFCLPAWGEPIDAGTDESVASAARLWRSLTLSHGITRNNYREPDPLGRVDPLDSETGSIPTTQVTLRWRGKMTQAFPELAVQAQASYAQGQTDYNGYLQQGITLTPYSARTGNTMQAYNLRVGLPLNAFTQQHWAQHIAPYAEQSWHHWQRNLTQYGETFTWQTTSIGVMTLWPLADLGLSQFSRFSLEADLATGRNSNLHMAAPALGFAADLDSTSTQSAAVSLHYEVTPTWLIGLRYEAQHINFGASPTVAGLKYPSGRNSTQSLAASLGRHF